MSNRGALILAEIVETLEDTHERLVLLLARRVARGATENASGIQWARERLAETQEVILEARGILASSEKQCLESLDEFITHGNRVGRAWANLQIQQAGGTGLAGIQTSLTPIATGNTLTLAREAAGDITNVHAGMLRSANAAYRNAVTGALRGLSQGRSTLPQATWEAVGEMAKRGLPGFIDRSGRGWRPETYAEMALRTAYTRASIQGKVDRFVEGGREFVQVSDSPFECPVCREWEGRVLSISDSPLPPASHSMSAARAAGLWHPRCTHSVNLFTPGFTQPLKAVANPVGYRESQRQRALERRVRERKRVHKAALVAGDEKARARAWRLRRAAEGDLKGFLEETGRSRRSGATLIEAPPSVRDRSR